MRGCICLYGFQYVIYIYSGYWLFALLASACGLCLSDEAIRRPLLRSDLGWLSIYVNHIAARVKPTLMRGDCTAFAANATPAGPQDINS